MMRILQIAHLSLIFLTAIGFTALKVWSHDYDPLIISTDRIVVLASAAWGSYLTVELIRRGKNDNVRTNLLSRYRNLLSTNKLFLAFTNAVLAATFLYLCYQLIFFRSIDFFSTKNTELFERGSDGAPSRIGKVAAGTSTSLRVKTGIRYFLFKSPGDSDYTALEPLTIPFIWKQQTIDHITLTHDHEYEIIQSD